MIYKFISNWTFVASSWALQTPASSQWIFSTIVSTSIMANSGMLLQASSIACSSPWACVTRLSRCRLSYSKFNIHLLKTWRVQPSLTWRSVVVPSYSWYRISLGRASKFNPHPSTWLVVAQSPSAVAKTVPSKPKFFLCRRATSAWLQMYLSQCVVSSFSGVAPIMLATPLWWPLT